jgi:hypothetical protein
MNLYVHTITFKKELFISNTRSFAHGSFHTPDAGDSSGKYRS